MDYSSSSDVLPECGTANDSLKYHTEFMNHVDEKFSEVLYRDTKDDLLSIGKHSYTHNLCDVMKGMHRARGSYAQKLARWGEELAKKLFVENNMWSKIDGVMGVKLTRLIILLLCNWVRINHHKSPQKVKRWYSLLFFSVLINIESLKSKDVEIDKLFQALCAVMHEYCYKMPPMQKNVFVDDFRHIVRHGATYGFAKLKSAYGHGRDKSRNTNTNTSVSVCIDMDAVFEKQLDELLNAQLYNMVKKFSKKNSMKYSNSNTQLENKKSDLICADWIHKSLIDVVGKVYHTADGACADVFSIQEKKEYHLFIVGSLRQNTYVSSSDIDLVVVLSQDMKSELLNARTRACNSTNGSRPNPFPPYEKQKTPGVLYRKLKTFADNNNESIEACYDLAETLHKTEVFNSIECVTSNVPTIKCRYTNDMYSNVRVDISFDVNTLRNTLFAAEYANQHNICVQLMKVVKLWAVRHKIADAFKGYFSGFQWMFLVVFYLQKSYHIQVNTNNTFLNKPLYVNHRTFVDLDLPFHGAPVRHPQKYNTAEEELAHKHITTYEYIKLVCYNCIPRVCNSDVKLVRTDVSDTDKANHAQVAGEITHLMCG